MPDPVLSQLPAGNISGNEAQDQANQAALIQKYVAEALASAGKNPQETEKPAGPTFTPITLTDPVTGQELKFNSPEELKVGFAETLARYGASQNQIAQLATQLGATVQKPAGNPEEFSRERLAELAEKDPLEGIKYVNQFAMKADLDKLNAIQAEVQNLRGELAASEFRAAHQQMVPVLNDPNGLKQFMAIFQQSGHQTFTRQSLEDTYAKGVTAGLFPPPPQILERWRGGSQPQNTSPTLPPYLGGNSGGALQNSESELLKNFDKLSANEMHAVLTKLGAFGPIQ